MLAFWKSFDSVAERVYWLRLTLWQLILRFRSHMLQCFVRSVSQYTLSLATLYVQGRQIWRCARCCSSTEQWAVVDHAISIAHICCIRHILHAAMASGEPGEPLAWVTPLRLCFSVSNCSSTFSQSNSKGQLLWSALLYAKPPSVLCFPL